ncbi:MAG TPA: anti-sigma factor [Aestuariivirgaceae bacterium]|nr:anti-sigma factor [Aestuariivirgaceae bacterium]
MIRPNNKHDWILHAYADGELEPSEKTLLERELVHDAEARAAIEAWHRQKQALKQAFSDVMSEEIPPIIKATLNVPDSRQRHWQLPAAAAAVFAIVLIVSAIYLNFGLGRAEARTLAEEALSAHIVYAAEIRHPVEVPAAEKEHLISWLSKRLDGPIELPDLSSQGFHLIGGRLLHEGRRPAAQFMYEDNRHRRLTIYLAHNSGRREASFKVQKEGGYTTCYWLEGGMGYAVAGELAPADIVPLAQVIYATLEGER